MGNEDGTSYETALYETLVFTTGSASYWGDDEDRQLYEPESSRALRAGYELLNDSSSLFWRSDFDERGQVVAWLAEDTNRTTEGVVAAVELSTWVERLRVEEKAFSLSATDMSLSHQGGAWWSTPLDTKLTRSLSATAMQSPDFRLAREDAASSRIVESHLFSVPAHSRVLNVADLHVWRSVVDSYPLEVTASRRGNYWRQFGMRCRWLVPDWEKVSQDFDAVFISNASYLMACGIPQELSPDYRTVMAGFNPGETIWLTDC